LLHSIPHSGEKIKNSIIDVLKDYGIEDRIIAITTDNATNNIKGIELLNEYFEKEFNSNICHFPCFGHVLNLSINNGIKQISKILNNLRIIASKLKNSPKQQQTFDEIAKLFGENNVKLKRDIYQMEFDF
jgi:hypothetical protein